MARRRQRSFPAPGPGNTGYANGRIPVCTAPWPAINRLAPVADQRHAERDRVELQLQLQRVRAVSPRDRDASEYRRTGEDDDRFEYDRGDAHARFATAGLLTVSRSECRRASSQAPSRKAPQASFQR